MPPLSVIEESILMRAEARETRRVLALNIALMRETIRQARAQVAAISGAEAAPPLTAVSAPE
jgi:hypothetical protein